MLDVCCADMLVEEKWSSPKTHPRGTEEVPVEYVGELNCSLFIDNHFVFLRQMHEWDLLSLHVWQRIEMVPTQTGSQRGALCDVEGDQNWGKSVCVCVCE